MASFSPFQILGIRFAVATPYRSVANPRTTPVCRFAEVCGIAAANPRTQCIVDVTWVFRFAVCGGFRCADRFADRDPNKAHFLAPSVSAVFGSSGLRKHARLNLEDAGPQEISG